MTTIDDVFGPTGLLAQKFQGYSPRPAQVRFATACEATYTEGGILLADEPVGTGKSFGYLVPAILNVLAKGGKCVVVTSNIALQEQLIKKDLPFLASLLPQPFTFGIAKGFGNYVCKAAIDQADTDRMMGKKLYLQEDQKTLEEVLQFEWQEGDLSELPYELPTPVKKLVVIQSEDCMGKKCSHFEDCYPKKAKKKCGDAQVIVTNYHMYAIELAMKLKGSERGILPEHRLVVFDEAHQMAQLCRSYFGDQLSAGSLINLTAELEAKGKRAEILGIPANIDPALRNQIKLEAERFFEQLSEVQRSKSYQARLKVPQTIDGKELQELLSKAANKLREACTVLTDDAVKFLSSRADTLEKKAALIQGARELDRKGWIYYLDGGDHRLTLQSEPVNVGEFLDQALWSKQIPRAKVLCSGTLATDTGVDGFAYASSQLGITDAHNVSEIVGESPFDYSRSVLVVPSGKSFPEPGQPGFSSDVARILTDLAKAAGGRTMGLFTSYANLKVAREHLREATNFRILEQGTVPRTTLIRMMKEQPENTVLLGTDSFFEGVDLPGRALEALLIDKIPFDHMEDPLLDAIKTESLARGDKWGWFNRYYLAKAGIKLRQGNGRLLRSVSDYGVVVCCDKRLTSKGYGTTLRRGLPSQMLLSDKIGAVGEYLRALKAGEKLDLPLVA